MESFIQAEITMSTSAPTAQPAVASRSSSRRTVVGEEISGAVRRDRLDLFWSFVYERQRVYVRRFVDQSPPPWTSDRILRTERFTNIYRELDPGTRYVIESILERDAAKPDKIFNTMVYRLIGRAETHASVGFLSLDTFDPADMEARLRQLRDQGRHVFTAAYMVSAYTSMGSRDKITNICRLFARLASRFAALSLDIDAAVHPSEVYHLLRSVEGFGNFLAYQVLVDLLYPLKILGNRPLLPFTHDDWAAAGPGAVRGIKMLLRDGIAVDELEMMRWLREHQHSEFERLGLRFPYLANDDGSRRDISLANIQNCLCEFHKYVKIGAGTGRGRRKFVPTTQAEVVQPSLLFDSALGADASLQPGDAEGII